HAVLRFDPAGHFGRQLPIAGINLACFQRTSESAHHATGSCGNDVINRRGVRLLQLCGVNFVMFGDGPVDAINHGLGLAGQVRNAERALAAFYARFRNINDVTHGLHPSDQSSLVQSTLAWIYTSSHSPKFLGAYGSFSPTPCRIYLMYWYADNGNIRVSHFRYVKMAFG